MLVPSNVHRMILGSTDTFALPKPQFETVQAPHGSGRFVYRFATSVELSDPPIEPLIASTVSVLGNARARNSGESNESEQVVASTHNRSAEPLLMNEMCEFIDSNALKADA